MGKIRIDKTIKGAAEFLGEVIALIILFPLLILISSILIGLLVNNHEDIWLISIVGCFAILFWLTIIAIFTWYTNKYEKNTEYVVEAMKSEKNIVGQLSHSPKLFGYYLLKTNSLKVTAAAVVCIFLYDYILLEVGSNDWDMVFSTENYKSGYTLLFLGLTFLSMTSDIKSSNLNKTSKGGIIIYFIGALVFFKSFMVYLVGLFGSKEAFAAIKNYNDVTPMNFVFYLEDLSQVLSALLGVSPPLKFTDSYAGILFHELNIVWFAMIFCIIPLWIWNNCRAEIKNINERGFERYFPKNLLQGTIMACWVYLMIPLYVAGYYIFNS